MLSLKKPSLNEDIVVEETYFYVDNDGRQCAIHCPTTSVVTYKDASEQKAFNVCVDKMMKVLESIGYMQHKHAQVLRAVANGKEIQVKDSKGWIDDDLSYICHPKNEYRVKPDITLDDGSYYPVSLRESYNNSKEHILIWTGDHFVSTDGCKNKFGIDDTGFIGKPHKINWSESND